MTNTRIIYDAAINAGIYTPSEADAIMQQRGALPLHTFIEWRRMGYSVKKGEKAVMALPLWKYTDKAPKEAREAAQAAGEELEADPHYYKKLSYLFHASQVERTKAGRPAGVVA